MKVVINTCWGGYEWSTELKESVALKKGINVDDQNKLCMLEQDCERHDSDLVQVVEECQNTFQPCYQYGYTLLKVVEIPDWWSDIYYIFNLGGMEHVKVSLYKLEKKVNEFAKETHTIFEYQEFIQHLCNINEIRTVYSTSL